MVSYVRFSDGNRALTLGFEKQIYIYKDYFLFKMDDAPKTIFELEPGGGWIEASVFENSFSENNIMGVRRDTTYAFLRMTFANLTVTEEFKLNVATEGAFMSYTFPGMDGVFLGGDAIVNIASTLSADNTFRWVSKRQEHRDWKLGHHMKKIGATQDFYILNRDGSVSAIY